VCQKAVEYLKKLGYFYDLSFDSFLSPNTKDTSRILSYLLELIFKTEEGEGKNQKA
jgi:hypothetical protein